MIEPKGDGILRPANGVAELEDGLCGGTHGIAVASWRTSGSRIF